ALMRGLAHAVHTHPDLHQALRELLIEPELNGFAEFLRRAVRRGEVPPDNPALDFVPHMLIGALVARPLIDDQPVDHAFLTRYVDAVVLPALGV
ncbi:TetR-like C-terminal domain-containing protein, partial [Streptomyces roseolus]